MPVIAHVLMALTLGVPPLAPVTGPIVVSASTGHNRATVKSATAVCPAVLPAVLGAGGRISDGQPDVVLTDVIPSADLTSVTVWGHVRAADIDPAWSLTAFAVCGPAPATRQRVTTRVGPDATSPKVAVSTCPAGTRLHGTGYEITGGYGEVLPFRVQPSTTLTTLTVEAAEADELGADRPWSVLAHAICATPGASMALVTSTSPVDALAPLTWQAGPGPVGTRLHGVGGWVDATGHGFISALVPELAAQPVPAARATRTAGGPTESQEDTGSTTGAGGWYAAFVTTYAIYSS